MIAKKTKHLEISWDGKDLRIYGDNRFVKGEIYIKKTHIYSVFCFLPRIWRTKKV